MQKKASLFQQQRADRLARPKDVNTTKYYCFFMMMSPPAATASMLRGIRPW